MAYALQSRLNSTICNVYRRCQHLTRCTSNVQTECRYFATRRNLDEEEDDTPVKYTASKANIVTASEARRREMRDDRPLSQTFSLWTSLGIFLIYFGYAREENDLDKVIDRDLHEVVPGLKEAHQKMGTRSGRDAAWREMEKTL